MTGPADKKRDDEILRLVSEGKSYSVVADMLDLRNAKGELSRNIVSGAVFRARAQGRYIVDADERFSHKGKKKDIRPTEDTKRSEGWRKRQETLAGKGKIPRNRMHPVALERELAEIRAVQDEAKRASEAPVENDSLTFLELRTNNCRRPLGQWDAKAEFYCGRPRMDVKTPYCAACHRLMYRPAFGQVNLWTTRGRAA